MNYLFLILFMLFTAQTFVQEELKPDKAPFRLILYPEVYQVIILEPIQGIQLTSLNNLPYNFSIIQETNKLEVIIEHSHYSTFEKTREALLENLTSILNGTAVILDSQTYGKEYLPSKYWEYTSSAKSLIKPYQAPF